MTEERRQELEQKLDAARAANDPAQIDAVKRTIDREVLECTARTAMRVKIIVKKVEDIDAKVDTIAAKLDTATAKKEGAVWMLKAMKYLATFLGGAGLVKLLAALPT